LSLFTALEEETFLTFLSGKNREKQKENSENLRLQGDSNFRGSFLFEDKLYDIETRDLSASTLFFFFYSQNQALKN